MLSDLKTTLSELEGLIHWVWTLSGRR